MIYAESFNDVIQDILDGLSNALCKDGQSLVQGNIDMNGYSLLNVEGNYALSLVSTSATSLTVGTGTKNLTVSAGCGYAVGMQVIVASTASPTNRMIGSITSYNSSTGALVVEVTTMEGSGTIAAWTVSPTVAPDFDNQSYAGCTFSTNTFSDNSFGSSTFTNFTETVKSSPWGLPLPAASPTARSSAVRQTATRL